jgi:NAD+ synthase (glutamine-hydrolysing)
MGHGVRPWAGARLTPPRAPSFEGNSARIVQSCALAKKQGARYRIGPELEITGYGCEDHFLEMDTSTHALEVLRHLVQGTDCTADLLCDFGLPMIHGNVRYNCRALCLNGKVLAVRPKQALADDGNYRESRWFSRWARAYACDMHAFPASWAGQAPVAFGDVYLELADASVGVESCEELFTPDSPHIRLGLAGVEVIGNGSGSHHQLRKLHTRVDLIRGATAKSGGAYLYANQSGCDGGRLLFDGCALVAVNGDVVAQGAQFSVADVEVVCANVDLQAVRAFRCFSASRGVQASGVARKLPSVSVDWNLCDSFPLPHIARAVPVRYHTPEEEIALGPAVWLYDYLRRSGASGFFLPLSGGADSSSTAAIVFSMCRLVGKAVEQGDALVAQDVRRILGLRQGQAVPTDPHALANGILHTAYLGTANSSARTANFAQQLSKVCTPRARSVLAHGRPARLSDWPCW